MEPIKAIGYVPSVAMDGKDDADKLAALCNAKIDQEVNSGFSIDSPWHQAEAICMNGGLANTIVLLGKIIGKQPTLENKQIPTISKIGEFDFQPDGTVNIRRVASIGPGKDIRRDPGAAISDFAASNIVPTSVSGAYESRLDIRLSPEAIPIYY